MMTLTRIIRKPFQANRAGAQLDQTESQANGREARAEIDEGLDWRSQACHLFNHTNKSRDTILLAYAALEAAKWRISSTRYHRAPKPPLRAAERSLELTHEGS
ncbi:MAG: hypothetical protein WAK66_16945 [Methylocystis sp.]